MIITFFKTDSKGSPWYYAVHDRQGNLFSEHSFSVIWGMNLDKGREKSYVFASRREMDAKLKSLFTRKIRDGYRVLYSFSRTEKYRNMFQDTTERSAMNS